jgi:hypothetical protein
MIKHSYDFISGRDEALRLAKECGFEVPTYLNDENLTIWASGMVKLIALVRQQDITFEDWSDGTPTHHLCAVIKDRRLKLYLDGVDVLTSQRELTDANMELRDRLELLAAVPKVKSLRLLPSAED